MWPSFASVSAKVIVWRLFGVKPLPEPTVTYCQWGPLELTYVKFQLDAIIFIWHRYWQFSIYARWRNQMETYSALLTLSPVTGEFPSKRPATRGGGVFFDLRLNKLLSKQRDAGDLRHHRAYYDVTLMDNGNNTYSCKFTETKMSSFWWNFHHWLHWKLSFWQLSVQPVMKISSKWRHFRFSVGAVIPLPNMTWHYTRQCNGLGMTQIRYCNHKRHHIPRPHGRAICGCPLSLLFDQVSEFFPMKKLDFKFLDEINSLVLFGIFRHIF